MTHHVIFSTVNYYCNTGHVMETTTNTFLISFWLSERKLTEIVEKFLKNFSIFVGEKWINLIFFLHNHIQYSHLNIIIILTPDCLRVQPIHLCRSLFSTHECSLPQRKLHSKGFGQSNKKQQHNSFTVCFSKSLPAFVFPPVILSVCSTSVVPKQSMRNLIPGMRQPSLLLSGN